MLTAKSLPYSLSVRMGPSLSDCLITFSCQNSDRNHVRPIRAALTLEFNYSYLYKLHGQAYKRETLRQNS